MLEGLPAVILPLLDAAAEEAASLEDAVEAWASVPGGTDELGEAQAAWRAAADAWQVAEVLQIGPAAPSTSSRGGEDGRDEIYSWPTSNPCRVDQEIVEEGYLTDSYFDDNLVNVYGLDALEYLLFHPGLNACAGQHPINEDGTWDALSPSELLSRRATFARRLAVRVRGDMDVLVTAWEPSGGDFAGELASAGTGSTVYTTELQGVNAVFDALFYIELETKDAKLGVPLGRVEGCGAPPCADLVESRWALESTAHLAANLRGFRALYFGGEGLGFDDLLIGLGEDELHGRVDSALNAAEASIIALGDADVGSLLTDAPADVDAAYDAVKALADLLKNELPLVLILQVPNEAGGDND